MNTKAHTIIFYHPSFNLLLVVVAIFLSITPGSGNNLIPTEHKGIETITAIADTATTRNYIIKARMFIDAKRTDSAIFYAQKTYQWSFNHSFDYGLLQSQLLLAQAYELDKNYPTALSYYLKYLNEINSDKNEKLVSDIYIRIGLMYQDWQIYEKALEYLKLAKSKDKYQQPSIKWLESIANVHLSLNNTDSALHYYDKALHHYYAKNNLEAAIGILAILVDINKNLGYFQNAIDNEMVKLDYYRQLENRSGEFSSLNNLGFLYKRTNDFAKALEYFNKSLEISSTSKLKASVLLNMAVIYNNTGDYDSALEHLFKALNINMSNKSLIETAKTYNMLAKTHQMIFDFETAINYGKMAIEIGEKTKNLSILNQSYLIVSEIYYDQESFEMALDYFKKYAASKRRVQEIENEAAVEVLAKKYLVEKTEKELKLSFAEEELKDLVFEQLVYEKQQKEKELQLQKENNILLNNKYELEKSTSEQRIQLVKQKLEAQQKDKEISLLNSEKKIKDIELKQKEAEQKEQQKEIQLLESNNRLLEQEKQLDRLKDEKARYIRNLLIAGFFITAVVLLLILQSYFRKLKTNSLLRAKNMEINQQKSSIEKQAQELHSMNEHLIKLDNFKDSLTGMIIHDLKNPLNIIINASTSEKIKGVANKMLLMVMNILDVQKFEDAELKIDRQNISLSVLTKNSLNQITILADEKNITLKNTSTHDYILSVDPDLTERVLVNLLTNAVKYTPNNGTISIAAEPCGEQNLKIAVTDTGEGVPEDKKHLIFEKFGQVNAKNLGVTRSTGLGLTFCKMAIEAHGEKIGVDSGKAGGSVFWFTVKIKQHTPDIRKQETENQISRDRLSEFAIKMLKPKIVALKQTKFYEISALRKILITIDDSIDDEVKAWKKNLMGAINSGNKIQYEQLLKMVDNE